MPNRLSKETSPYLLQHAHNPVDWYPWGEEALRRAKEEDKPMLVSIGYAACHWCHVMERESFENEEVAALMNEHFINIKVDREERPDVDHLYMDAVQAMTGSGGWPLNVFLTPDGRPFYGGTYFPPRRAFNRASWTEVLSAVAQSFREKRDEIDTQAQNLTEHLQVSNAFGTSASGAPMTADKIDQAFAAVMKTADREWGGFGRAPKFPQTFTVNFLLAYAHLTGNEEALQQALLSLDKMLQGGVYDHIGGGFARYSTDTEWLVPHFEKMLYDNALLVSSLADAYSLTKNETYKQVIAETLLFVERELLHPDGGFYSALDADSEGEEGKFYVWQCDEVKEILGAEAALFCDYFDITPQGNWEGRNIPWVKVSLKQFAQQTNLDEKELGQLLADGKQKLLQERGKRVRPLLDDKLLLNWNALMNMAYSKAYAATGNERYKEMAVRNMRFLLSAFGPDFNQLHHSWKESQAKHPPFLDDYAFLIAALVELAQIVPDFSYLDKAGALAAIVLEQYADEASPYFFYTRKGQEDILIRKKEIYDGATPSGNSVMAGNLYRLGILLDKPEWRTRAEEMVQAMGEIPVKYPTSFGVWLSLLYEMLDGTAEIAIVGQEFSSLLGSFLQTYLPHKLIMAAPAEMPRFPLLADKKIPGKTHIFLCRNYVCQQPVTTLAEALKHLSVK
ncbi:MAG TPA: thioredoxin domain-containing protein [Flavisolibacter sp.]|nr:thioredoxin domain-containing protein [Flavisolibacter sp.]